MTTTADVYNRLFAGETLTLQFSSKEQYETLRTALCKKNSFSVALDLTDASVLATWNETSLRGTFRLGESAKKRNENKWQIIETPLPPEQS